MDSRAAKGVGINVDDAMADPAEKFPETADAGLTKDSESILIRPSWLKGRIWLTVITSLIFLLPVPYAFAASPAVGTITPSSGSSTPDQWVTFTTTYTDADGWTNLQEVRFLTNTSTSQANTVSLGMSAAPTSCTF